MNSRAASASLGAAPLDPRGTSSTSDGPPSRLALIRGVAAAFFAGALVYVAYYPSDSVAVERGDGLWFAAIAIITAMLAWCSPLPRDAVARRDLGLSRSLDALAIGLAMWMMFSAFVTSPPGNLRQATNEAWFWVGGAALFTAARRLLSDGGARRVAVALLVAIAVCQGVHAMHQKYLSLPRSLEEYRENPERILRLAGVDAPPGSATRMVFENRLIDGGPTGTFALANSLAGVLLVGFVVLVGLLVVFWRRHSIVQHLSIVAVAGVVFAALLATHSRSGVLAAIVGAVAVVAMMIGSRTRASARAKTAWLVGVAASVLSSGVAAASLAVWGKEEWIAQAPASLAFRFQYWRATARLVADHPLWGAGPGNFQAMYPRYRDARAAESIAEPHNFFFETWAAGGFVAAIALAVLIVVWFLVARRRSGQFERDSGVTAVVAVGAPSEIDAIEAGRWTRWWWLGSGFAFAMVWLLGLATGQAPDFDAQMLAVPLAGLAMVVAWKASGGLSEGGRDVGPLVSAALLGLLLHLLVSGGWTVPGVAIWVWTLAAMRAPVVVAPMRDSVSVGTAQVETARRGESSRRPAATARVAVSLGTGVLLLLLLRSISLGPVEAAATAMRRASAAQSQGQVARAAGLLQEAATADPWAPEATLWLADLYHWQVVAHPDHAAHRRRWREAVEATLERGGADPALLRLVAAGPLHVYQRWGRIEDLRWAAELFALAGEAAPTDAAVLAQRAEIAETLGDEAFAVEAAARAVELSELGQNQERRLWLQPILVVKRLGDAATAGPVMRPASELLANQLDMPHVARDTGRK